MLKVIIVLELKFRGLKRIRKPLASKRDTDNLEENIGHYQEMLNEKPHGQTNYTQREKNNKTSDKIECIIRRMEYTELRETNRKKLEVGCNKTKRTLLIGKKTHNCSYCR